MINSYLRKKALAILITTFLMITIFSTNMAFSELNNVQSSSSYDPDIIIPDDYPTIQEGINNAEPGDKIFIKSGIYNENIVVNKKGLSLKGENKFNTVIDIENSAWDAVAIIADGVTFEGFAVTNARNKDKLIWNQSGIVISSSNVIIRDNIISYNRLGIMSYVTAFNLTICDNMFFYDGFFPGCYIICSNGSVYCTDNIPMESLILNVCNNTVNGKPLYYYKDIRNAIVNENAGQVILVNCTNITIKNVYLANIDFSVMLYYCSNCIVENSTILNADGELILFFSENNTIQNNTIINAFHCVCLDIGSKNNIVRYNKIYDSLQGITVISACTGNRVYENEFNGNTLAMKITSYTQNRPSHHNLVYNNKFSENDIGIGITTTFKDPLCYTYNNTIENNSFLKNKIGIEIRMSEGNMISNNIFKRNKISAVFLGCSQNFWENNYWNRPRLLPKIVLGYKMINSKIPIPWANFDRHPK